MRRLWVDGRLTCELGRDLYQGFRDEDGDGVEVRAVGFEAEALGFQGDRTSPPWVSCGVGFLPWSGISFRPARGRSRR